MVMLSGDCYCWSPPLLHFVCQKIRGVQNLNGCLFILMRSVHLIGSTAFEAHLFVKTLLLDCFSFLNTFH